MKTPYSYKQHFFAPVLTVSIAAHLAFFAAEGFVSVHPQYGVDAGLSSVEVLILKDEKVEKEAPKEEKIMLAKDSTPETLKVVKKNFLEKTPEPKIKKNIYIPAQQGAIAEYKPDYLRNPAPQYPLIARENGWQGVTLLRITVQKDGSPADISLEKSSGHTALDEAAMKAVKKWRFKPAGIGQVSFASTVRVPIRFTLVDKD